MKFDMGYPGLRKGSTLRVGVSTFESSGTPSNLRRSKKFWHSAMSNAHSASARPAYLLGPADAPRGSRGWFFDSRCGKDCRKWWALRGSFGGYNFLSLLGTLPFSNHSRENLKE